MIRDSRLVSALILLACAVGCSSGVETAPPADPSRPSLVLITVDTLRADHLSSYGYFRTTTPAIDALAQEAVVFENVVAAMATTLPSHTSLLTSTYPARHGVLSNLRFFKQAAMTSDEVRSIAWMLSDHGYRTAAFTSSSPLCEESGIGSGFETFAGPPRYEENDRRTDVPAEQTVDRALGWISEATHPFFLWVHLFDPHTPYKPPAPYGRGFRDNERLWKTLYERKVPDGHVELATRATNAYDGEIQYTDAQISRLLEALEERGLYDDSIVVFTSDHGEGLLQHGILEHGVIWNEQLRVPLVIRFPGGQLPPGADRREKKLVSLIDVMPTLAAATALPLDTTEFDGVDIYSTTRETALAQREIRDNVWPAANFALVGLDWKYSYFADADDMLFHLAEDPYETRNVIEEHPGIADEMKTDLLRLVEENQSRSPLAVSREIPEDIRRQLEALGYVE